MKHALVPALCIAALTSCAGLGRQGGGRPAADVAPLDAAQVMLQPGAQSAAALDQTTDAEKAAALAAPVAGARELGKTSVALGSPAEQGFWLKSPLVSAPGKGKVVTASGASVAVDLLPGSGGALLSLAAYRALGLALTDLPEVTVFAE
ncbi:hypothetical protein [Tabrizicola oligotrophica]|uniref:D-galactarate dehydratase n=1 Tax=Tabrizicola oligotrophica TaxID=2710650 RepID=A0A6M0QPG9_9RHOB|nr:hypothetical protein [Tabrizicola oligotrophica]NEY89329.1 hypothetical protein [Tabrizicola oligotrophica]